MDVYCTYCSAHKDRASGLMPALQRYKSDRIQRIVGLARTDRVLFLILSGEYGLLDSLDLIPWHNHLLRPAEVDTLAQTVAAQLEARGVTSMRYFTRPLSEPKLVPYADVAHKASRLAHVELQIAVLEGETDQ